LRLVARFRSFFAAFVPDVGGGNIADHLLVAGPPDQFAADWNESKHADLLSSLAPMIASASRSVNSNFGQGYWWRAEYYDCKMS